MPRSLPLTRPAVLPPRASTAGSTALKGRKWHFRMLLLGSFIMGVLVRVVTHRPALHSALEMQKESSHLDTNNKALVIKTRICENIKEGQHSPLWTLLCLGGIDKTVNTVIQRGEDITIVQIGAHTGYEENDPLASGLTSMIHELGSTMHDKVHWTFVEPSPPNYKRLVKNLANHSDVCDLRSVKMRL
jgi:hypothetical protein